MVHSTAGSHGLFSLVSSMYSGSFSKKVVWVEKLVDVLRTLQMPMATALRQAPVVNGLRV